MGINELKRYIKERGEVTIPEVQKAFSLEYKETRSLFSKLEEEGAVEFKEGLTYVARKTKAEESSSKSAASSADGTSAKADDESEFERRRREFLRLIHGRRTEEEEEDEEFLKLCVKALDFCIDYKRASSSLIQRRFVTGYIKACKIVDWMRSKGYLIEQEGISGGRVILSRDKFNELYGHLNLYDEGEKERVSPSDISRLVALLKAVRDKKSQPITRSKRPDFSLWEDNCEFSNAVQRRYAEIIRANPDGGDAIRDAESRLDGVRDTHDRAMVQVYERVVYDLKGLTPDQYAIMRKYFCGS